MTNAKVINIGQRCNSKSCSDKAQRLQHHPQPLSGKAHKVHGISPCVAHRQTRDSAQTLTHVLRGSSWLIFYKMKRHCQSAVSTRCEGGYSPFQSGFCIESDACLAIHRPDTPLQNGLMRCMNRNPIGAQKAAMYAAIQRISRLLPIYSKWPNFEAADGGKYLQKEL